MSNPFTEWTAEEQEQACRLYAEIQALAAELSGAPWPSFPPVVLVALTDLRNDLLAVRDRRRPR